jgi:uncharacterized hydrophobic protein (TIGR00271 family)
MLHLNAFVPADKVEVVCDAPTSAPGVSHVMAGARTTQGLVSVLAEIEAEYADAAIDLLATFELASSDVTMWRIPAIKPLGWRQHARTKKRDTQVWSEVVDRADDNSEIVLTYVLYMVAAGVIAGVGVLTGSSILVVGAMAISPDLLPISATAIGIVERRWQLAARSSRALVLGLGIGALASCATTALLRISDRIPGDLVLADTTLGPSLTELGPGSVMVATAAGMAGMLAFERAGGAAVGVAISITTIPAAAYVGAAIALGRTQPMWGALLVLMTNVVVIIAASATTLKVQRRRHERRR